MKTKQLISQAFLAAALLLSSSALFAQVKIGTNPTTINAANNLEVEGSTAGRKVAIDKVTGKMTIADGSEGAAKVLTSDAAGVATWQAMRTTGITAFEQTTPGISLNFPPITAGTCPAPEIGLAPPACAVDLNQNGTFSITNAVNDVIIDLADGAALTGNSTTVYYLISVFLDKTTPGVFEAVGSEFITYSNIGCGTSPIRSKIALKNLPVRAGYNLKVFYTPWMNTGTAARIGLGTETSPGSGCGRASSYLTNKLIVSVSQ